jgi:hypothetical protein
LKRSEKSLLEEHVRFFKLLPAFELLRYERAH